MRFNIVFVQILFFEVAEKHTYMIIMFSFSAEISYLGKISILKSDYIIEVREESTRQKRSTNLLDYVKLRKDLRTAV